MLFTTGVTLTLCKLHLHSCCSSSGASLHWTTEDVQQLPSTSAVRLQRASAHMRCPDVRTDTTPVQHRHAAGQQDLPEQTQHGHEIHLL